MRHSYVSGNDQLTVLKVSTNDEDDKVTPVDTQLPYPIPNSPPPSFRSRASSPTADQRLLTDDPLANDEDRTLADAFDSPSDDDGSDDEDGGLDDRQRLMRGHPETTENEVAESESPRQGVQRRVTQLPVFQAPAAAGSGRVYGGGQNDGVWANLSAKPTRGEEVEEKPPVCTLNRMFRNSLDPF